MEARMHKSAIDKNWTDVYKAALFEEDNAKIPQRIAEAEGALAARALELVGAGDDQIHEQSALENARYFLRILGSIQETINTPSDYGNQTKPQSSNHLNQRRALFVPAQRQDLHTMI
jgi:hypothetical protein